MITPTDMCCTFIRKNLKDKIKKKTSCSEFYINKIYTYIRLQLIELENNILFTYFGKNRRELTREDFGKYIDIFLSEEENLFNFMNNYPENYFFEDLAINYLKEYLIEFKQKYTKTTLMRLYQLPNHSINL